MLVVVGLGNPGKKYEKTRHNAGFVFVERLADFFGWDSYYDVTDWEREDSVQYEFAEVKAASDVKVLLVKPQTFMNRSGAVVQNVVSSKRLKVADELVIAHDDLDIQLGEFKMQSGVSPKRHKGVLSIEHVLARKDFMRIRLGVDNRGGDRSIPGDEFVLQKMVKEEEELLDNAVANAVKQLRQSLEL